MTSENVEMSQVEEEKYLTNRAKVERIKAKVKIRFKELIANQHETNRKKVEMKSMISWRAAVMFILPLLHLFLIASGLSAAATIDRKDIHARHLEAISNVPIANVGTSSELSFEYLGLKTVPSEQLCLLMEAGGLANSSTLPIRNQVNSLSFANNRISRLDPNAFSCVASRLKILSLRNNLIESISHAAFNGLNQLQVLLLDGNQLKEIPAIPLGRLAATLRHLSLADNLIRNLEETPGRQLNLPNLISLSLKANPLDQAASRDAFKALSKLKTLTLTQVGLNKTSGHLNEFAGLGELRHLHLDQLTNLSSLSANYCQSSRNLASLILRSNKLVEVPALAHCQALLSIDLSYNKITGTLEANFSSMPNLIDLYLSFNLIEHLDENAFKGLMRLQVLDLSSNKLKQIHPNAFVPLRASLYELNVAHNQQLSQLTHLTAGSLDQLIVFKAHGNVQLRRLPRFPRAQLLAFTYAYHCCDYNGERGTLKPPLSVSLANGNLSGATLTGHLDDDEEATQSSFTGQLFQLVLAKLARFLSLGQSGGGGGTQSHEETPWQVHSKSDLGDETEHMIDAGQDSSPSYRRRQLVDTEGHTELLLELRGGGGATKLNGGNLSDIVLWPASTNIVRDAAPSVLTPAGLHERLPRQRRRRRRVARGSGARPEVVEARGGGGASRWTSSEFSTTGRLIDELIWQVKQIRFSHSVGPPWPPPRADEDEDDYAPLADANEREQGEWTHSSSRAMREAPSSLSVDLLAGCVARELARDFPVTQSSGERVRREISSNDGGDLAESSSRKAGGGEGTPKRVQCLPKPNAFQPCADLFESPWLRASIWLIWPLAFVGNTLVIIVLGSARPSSSTSALTSIMWFQAAHSKRHIDVPRFLVLNLAIADLMMALYLGLLALVDLSTWGEFRVYAIKWQHSGGCKLAGFLAVLSSELSVFILAIITLERNYAITNAVHLNRRLSLQKAMVLMLVGYLYALTMALLPLNGVNDFRSFSVCLPLEFHPTRGLWSSSANLYLATLIGVNSLSFLLLLSCYLRMYCAIRGSQAWNTNDLKIAKRMSVLVLTDFMCWIPIIFVATLTLFGNYLIGPEGLKVLIIFILPLNSVANPFLYAITTKKFKRDLKLLKKRLKIQQFCEILRLTFGFLTTCKRQKRRQQQAPPVKRRKFDQNATVAIRRNGHRFNPPASEPFGGQVRHAKNANMMLLVASNKSNGQLELDRQGRNCIDNANNPARSASHVATRQNNGAHSRQQQQVTIRVIRDKRASNKEPNPGTIRKGSLLLAKTIRLVRGGNEAPNENNANLHDYDAQDEDEDFDQALNNTFNQVTMNRTTCFSCHQRLYGNDFGQNSVDSLDSPPGNQLVGEQFLSLPPRHLVRPQIVLDSIELHPPINANSCTTPSEFIAQQQLHAKLSQQQQQRERSQSPSIRLPASRQVSCQSNLSGNPRGSPISLVSSMAAPNESGSASLRPSSADEGRATTTSSTQGFGDQFHASCQTILMNERGGSTNLRLKSGPHGETMEVDLEGASRSVSACAFVWPTVKSSQQHATIRLQSANQSQQRVNVASVKQACSCSCDAIGQKSKVATSNWRKHARHQRRQQPNTAGTSKKSINKLVFEPFARAWSSLQISFQAQRAASPTQNVLAEQQQAKNKEPTIENAVIKSNETTSSGEDESGLLNESTIIDDILQMSSPSRRRLLRERRMSRSCEMIASHESNSSSVATNEPTTTTTTGSSFYDQNDDQRILLATINQLTTRRKKRRMGGAAAAAVPGSRQKQLPLSAASRRRAACTRCRSWSPALLDKLEDCMYQIKSRLPKLGGEITEADDQQLDYAQMNQQKRTSPSTSSPTTSNSDLMGHSGDFEDKSVMGGVVEADSRAKNLQELINEDDHRRAAAVASPSSAAGLEVDDSFNEIGLDEWTRHMQMKAPGGYFGHKPARRRLYQQLSGNSDTLSSRTVGTTMTNLSFDSSSSIPATVAAVAASTAATITQATSSTSTSGCTNQPSVNEQN